MDHNTQLFRFLSSLSLVASSLIFPITSTEGAEYLEPIQSDRLMIDGDLNDWKHVRRQSAEYLLKGVIASLDDFRGGARIAYNSEWLYIALDCMDSDIIRRGSRGDHVRLRFSGKTQAQNAEISFSFKAAKKQKAKPSPRGFSWQSKNQIVRANSVPVEMRLNRRPLKVGQVKAMVDQGRSYSIEAKVPMSTLPWLYGNEIKFTAIFEDFDSDQGDSTYATHLIDQNGDASDVGYIFGGAHLFRELYRQQVGSVRVIQELSHQWVGDQRDELVLITDTEIVIFGEGVSSNGGIVRYIHGWQKPEQTKTRIEGKGKNSVLVVQHFSKTQARKDVDRFKLINGEVVRQ